VTKCPGFFVYVWIAVKSVGLYEAKEKAPPVGPGGFSIFLVWGMSRNASQVSVWKRPEMPHKLRAGVLATMRPRHGVDVIVGAITSIVGVATIIALVTVASRLISEAAATNG
jgi:hypothetical protein